MSKVITMTGYEQHEYRRSLRQRADKRRSLTRREARRLKRKEGSGTDVEALWETYEYENYFHPLPPSLLQ